jgi:hypothetical protein
MLTAADPDAPLQADRQKPGERVGGPVWLRAAPVDPVDHQVRELVRLERLTEACQWACHAGAGTIVASISAT